MFGISEAVKPLGPNYEYLELVFGIAAVTVVAVAAGLFTAVRLGGAGALIYAGVAAALAFEGSTACATRGKCEDWMLSIIVFGVFAAAPVVGALLLGRKAQHLFGWQQRVW